MRNAIECARVRDFVGFLMKTELLREMSCRFLQNELGHRSFLFHLFEENTTLHDISKNFSLFNFQIF